MILCVNRSRLANSDVIYPADRSLLSRLTHHYLSKKRVNLFGIVFPNTCKSISFYDPSLYICVRGRSGDPPPPPSKKKEEKKVYVLRSSMTSSNYGQRTLIVNESFKQWNLFPDVQYLNQSTTELQVKKCHSG